jgi:hypothetical protein
MPPTPDNPATNHVRWGASSADGARATSRRRWPETGTRALRPDISCPRPPVPVPGHHDCPPRRGVPAHPARRCTGVSPPEAARMCTDERVVHPGDAVRADPVALRCTTDAPHITCPSVRARHHQPPRRAPEPPRHPEPASGPPPHPGCTSHPIHPAGQPDIPSNAPFSPRNSEREGAGSLDRFRSYGRLRPRQRDVLPRRRKRPAVASPSPIMPLRQRPLTGRHRIYPDTITSNCETSPPRNGISEVRSRAC